MLRIDNYVINTPIIDILTRLKIDFPSQKLKDIKIKNDSLQVTCVNSEHKGGMEQNPDAHINLDEHSKVPYAWYYCFACHISCSFEKFIALYLDASIDVAKRWLIENFGVKDTDYISLGEPISLTKSKTTSLDEHILENYQHWTPYLQKRKISRETAESLKIRYDPVSRQVIFPIYDIHNNLKMLARRSIDNKIFYLDENVEKEVYCLNIIQKNNISSCIITEGLIDCATGWTYGMPTIATLGSISDHQIKQINSSCIKHLYLMMDNDVAGKKFTETLKKRLAKRILLTEINIPKPAKDLNDLSLSEFNNLIKIKK